MEFYGSILKPWNVTAIKRMHIQCVPGALFPSLSRLGTRLSFTLSSANLQTFYNICVVWVTVATRSFDWYYKHSRELL